MPEVQDESGERHPGRPRQRGEHAGEQDRGHGNQVHRVAEPHDLHEAVPHRHRGEGGRDRAGDEQAAEARVPQRGAAAEREHQHDPGQRQGPPVEVARDPGEPPGVPARLRRLLGERERRKREHEGRAQEGGNRRPARERHVERRAAAGGEARTQQAGHRGRADERVGVEEGGRGQAEAQPAAALVQPLLRLEEEQREGHGERVPAALARVEKERQRRGEQHGGQEGLELAAAQAQREPTAQQEGHEPREDERQPRGEGRLAQQGERRRRRVRRQPALLEEEVPVEIEGVVLRDEVAAVPHAGQARVQSVAAEESGLRLVLPEPHRAERRQQEERAAEEERRHGETGQPTGRRRHLRRHDPMAG